MKYASVCSGVEAASLAWIPIGWEAAWFSEIEPFPCAVLKERFTNVPNLGDMTKIKIESVENGTKFIGTGSPDVVVPGGIDLLAGGTPCQDASVAGKREGLVEGSRSRLAFDFTRIAYESKAKWIVWENVPGVFSLNQGRDFAAFLSSLAGWDVAVPHGGWKNSGIVRNATDGNFGLAYRVLDAQYVRVDGFPRAIPQRRRRVFVVGYLGEWTRPASVLLESESVSGNTPPCRIKGKGFTADIESRSGESGRPWDNSGVNPTLNQCSPECGSIGSSNQELFSQNMNGIVMEKTVSIGNGQLGEIKASLEECSQTLHCMHDHSAISQDPICNSSHADAVNRNNGLEDVVCYDNQTYAKEPKDTGDISCTLQAHCGTGGNTVPLVQSVLSGAFFGRAGAKSGSTAYTEECCHTQRASMVIGKELKEGDRQTTGIGQDGEPCPTIQTEHHHAVAIAENIIGRKAENGGNGNGYTEELAYTQNATGVMGVSSNATVRRLLPVECERLMGFPDNWTRIPWKGKPEEECPDAPRYKACGNSMCVNVMRWIGMRIELNERKHRK